MAHDHSQATHSAACDEVGCTYVAKVHAHDDESAAMMLATDLADHNKDEHNKETDPKIITSAVAAKMKAL